MNTDLSKIPNLEKLKEHEWLVNGIIKWICDVDKVFVLMTEGDNDSDPSLILHPQFRDSFE